jgi:4-hydroxymandelate synthase
MSILGIEHVEFYVADLRAAAGPLCRDYGFTRADPPYDLGGQPGTRSIWLRQGGITVLLTAADAAGRSVTDYLGRHGDGVASIAFRTDDVGKAFDRAVAGGARPLAAPALGGDGAGVAVVSGFGDVTHRLVERAGSGSGCPAGMFEALDHVAICLPAGQIDATVALYRDAFGFCDVFDERIEVNGQAMISKVVQDEAGAATFTLIEPDPSLDAGQIDEFLDRHGGAGVQHLALRTRDIAAAVRTLSGRGVEFLAAPAGYYRRLGPRLGALAIPVEVLREVNVLADRDQWGELFQIFARSVHERGTFFIELIERRGALTFGSGNIKALYEALGEEQGSRPAAASRGLSAD